MADYICFWGVLADFPAARIFSTLQCWGLGAPQAMFTWGALCPGNVANWLCPGFASSDDNSDLQTKPSMGQLALYMLALRANCEFVGGHKGNRLVSQLKRFLEEEKRAIGEGCSLPGMGRAHQNLGFLSRPLSSPSSAYLTIHLEAQACPRSQPSWNKSFLHSTSLCQQVLLLSHQD